MARQALGPATLAVAQAVVRALAEHVEPGRPLLLGCSGGADSLALVVGVAEAVRRDPRPARALVVDHQLQAGSAEVAETAADQCRRLGVQAEVVAVTVEGDGGPEAAARAARHRALARASHALARSSNALSLSKGDPNPLSLSKGDEGAVVLLGHTLDDQAEQVLLGLARGSGPRSLSGMRVWRPGRPPLLRPLLALRRADTAACCAELGLRPWLDPSNADPSLTRARVRHRVLPVLTDELGPGVATALARTADLCRSDADALDALAAEHPCPDQPRCEDLVGLPDALRHRVLRRWLLTRGADQPGMGHVLAVDGLLTRWRGQGPIDVPGLRVHRQDGRLAATLTSTVPATPARPGEGVVG